MTSPMALNDLLMEAASFSSSPWTPDFSTRSDPARSTNINLPRVFFPDRRFVDVSTIDTNKCDRDVSAFSSVCATARCSRPLSRSATSSSSEFA